MKRYYFLFTILLISTFVFSQEKQNKSFFNIGENYSWYVSPSLSLTVFDINYGLIGNIDAGVSLNKKLSLGIFYSSGIFGVEPDGFSDEEGFNNYLDLAGIVISYNINPDQTFHPVLFLKSGFGNLANQTIETGEYVNFTLFTFSPGVSIDHKLTNHIKIGLQTSYRILSPVTLTILGETKLSGTEIGFFIKLGIF